MSMTDEPARAASIAAYMPAAPEPITSTSVVACMGSRGIRTSFVGRVSAESA